MKKLSSDAELERIKKFYDAEYYVHGQSTNPRPLPWHSRRAARRLGSVRDKTVLDVACGLGEWLDEFRRLGATYVAGVDLSTRAIEACRRRWPDGTFEVSPAESLPFADGTFDLVTCMGSLEHFVDKKKALEEMIRVARPDARFVLLVPNSGFLTRRLGLYGGTQQASIREDVKSLEEWQALFATAGLTVNSRLRDLHSLSKRWVMLEGRKSAPLRLLQALALICWPLRWQYQVYFFCSQSAR